MSVHVLILLMLCFPCVKSLYKALEDNSTKYWASESKFAQDPIHSYSESKLFCESLGGSMPIGTAEELYFLRSFLPLASYPYWLGQGSEFGTWSDGSQIRLDYETSHPECETNCGIHYQAGKLIKMSMDENNKANIVCKVVIDAPFFVKLLLTTKVILSSDQHEVAFAADFARHFLTIGFSIGVAFFIAFVIFVALVNHIFKLFCKAVIGEQSNEKEEKDNAECQPLRLENS